MVSLHQANTYTRLGVKVRVFHLGDYRRQALGTQTLPDDYFWADATEDTKALRARILEKCRTDLLSFFDDENGQVGIYDAVNPTSQHRHRWKEIFEQHDIQTIFIESLCDDQEIIEQNVRSVKISSPDVSPLPMFLKEFNCSMLAGIQMMLLKIILRESMPRFLTMNLSMSPISHISNLSTLINGWKYAIQQAILPRESSFI
jgi:6-phosphofructo-2-kinase